MIVAILKTILIIALILIAVIAVVVCFLLFSPISYSVDGSYKDETADGKIRLRLFFGLISGEISYHHGIAASGYISLLGMKLYRIEGRLEDDGEEHKGDKNDKSEPL